MPDVVLQHFEQYGVADTPLAPGALRMTATVDVIKREEPGQKPEVRLHLDLHGENSAVLDNCRALLKVSLMKGTTLVGSYLVRTDLIPMRGLQPAIVRDVHDERTLPQNLQYDGLGFTFVNGEHLGGPGVLDQIQNYVRLADGVVGLVSDIFRLVTGGGGGGGGSDGDTGGDGGDGGKGGRRRDGLESDTPAVVLHEDVRVRPRPHA